MITVCHGTARHGTRLNRPTFRSFSVWRSAKLLGRSYLSVMHATSQEQNGLIHWLDMEGSVYASSISNRLFCHPGNLAVSTIRQFKFDHASQRYYPATVCKSSVVSLSMNSQIRRVIYRSARQDVIGCQPTALFSFWLLIND